MNMSIVVTITALMLLAGAVDIITSAGSSNRIMIVLCIIQSWFSLFLSLLTCMSFWVGVTCCVFLCFLVPFFGVVMFLCQ